MIVDNSSSIGGEFWDTPLSPGLVPVLLISVSCCSKLDLAVRKLTTGSGVDVVPLMPCILIKSVRFRAAIKQTCASDKSLGLQGYLCSMHTKYIYM